jgi:multiple sugar transport system substrate-binding protein
MGATASNGIWRRHPSQQLRGKPEGPYETADKTMGVGVSNQEMERFLQFVEQFEMETDHILSIKKGYSEVRLLATLIRSHLSGKTCTTSSLVGASGLTYGTAIRAIDSIEERQLLVRRARTATGKSFSLHPTGKLLAEWQELARRFRSIIGKSYGSDAGDDNRDYYFGSSYSSGQVLPPPAIFPTMLPISGDLRLLEHADPTFMAMHSLKKQFETIFGVGINSRALSIDRLRDEILKNASLAKSRYDIVACDLPWFGEMAEAGHFLRIDKLIHDTGFVSDDFHYEALASARYKGRQYGLPVQTTPELLVYRRDVFENFDLDPPVTITQTLKAAKTIHNPFHGMAGMAWNGARGTPLGHSFLFVIAAFGQPVLNLSSTAAGFDAEWVEGENFRPMFDSPEARLAADYLVELLEYSPRGILNMSWFERARCFAEGEAGMAYCATLLAPLFETNKASPAHGQTEYLPHPYGPGGRPVAPLGGYALAIPSNIAPERIDPIWTALTSLTSERTVKLYIENGSLVSPRFSVSQDPEVQKISPLISIVDEMARFGVLQMWPRPPVPEITDIIAIVGEEMHDALRGDKSVPDALMNSQNRADALMRSHGHY